MIPFTLFYTLPCLKRFPSFLSSLFCPWYTMTPLPDIFLIVAPTAPLYGHATARAVPSLHYLADTVASVFMPLFTYGFIGAGC